MPWNDDIWHKYLRRPYKLHVTDHGGTGPTIILLHGIAASSAKWSNLIPLLTPTHHCITIDLIGFGESPKPQWYGYSTHDHIRAVRATIKSLRLPDGFTLMGHSLGSLLATRYASLWPAGITHLVLLSPPVYAPFESITSKAARTRNKLLLKLYRFLRTHPRMTPENFKRLSYILPLPKSIVRQPETWLPFFRTLEQCIEQQTIAQDIAVITVPIDIFYGSIDQVVVPFNIRALKNLKQLEIHRIPAANHDISKRYARYVATFLRMQDIS